MSESTPPTRKKSAQADKDKVVVLSAAVVPPPAESSAKALAIGPDTSEQWASAIITLMQVERRRFQDNNDGTPGYQVTGLETMGVSVVRPQGLAPRPITLRKLRSAPDEKTLEALKIQPFPSPKTPKS